MVGFWNAIERNLVDSIFAFGRKDKMCLRSCFCKGCYMLSVMPSIKNEHSMAYPLLSNLGRDITDEDCAQIALLRRFI